MDRYERQLTQGNLYQDLDSESKIIANRFCLRIENKNLNLLSKYEKILEPKGFLDSLRYVFNKQRMGRHAAVQKIIFLHSPKTSQNLENLSLNSWI